MTEKVGSTTQVMRPHLRVLTLYLPLVVMGIAFGVVALRSTEAPPRLQSNGTLTVLAPPMPLPDFSLRSSEGTSITPAALVGSWTFMTLGFTSCPDICPTTLSRLVATANEPSLAPFGFEILFVSVDPERDTVERLRDYTHHFGAAVTGATGTHDELHALTQPLGLFYSAEVREGDPSEYDVQHSTTVLVIDPRAEVVGLLRIGNEAPGAIARSLERLDRETR